MSLEGANDRQSRLLQALVDAIDDETYTQFLASSAMDGWSIAVFGFRPDTPQRGLPGWEGQFGESDLKALHAAGYIELDKKHGKGQSDWWYEGTVTQRARQAVTEEVPGTAGVNSRASLQSGGFQPIESEIIEGPVIGRGGFGEVIRYEHKRLKIPFAIKILNPVFPESPDHGIERFFMEARILFGLNHPGIVRIFDVGLLGDSGRAFIKMEHVRGRTLRQVRDAGLSPSEVTRIIRDLAAGLAYAHSAAVPVVHRDIKPSNVMVEDGTGRVVLLDFGLGIFVENEITRVTKAGEAPAGGSYTAPELMENPSLINPLTDVYSLGAIWFYLLFGLPPMGSEVIALIEGSALSQPERQLLKRSLGRIDARPAAAEVSTALTQTLAASVPAQASAHSELGSSPQPLRIIFEAEKSPYVEHTQTPEGLRTTYRVGLRNDGSDVLSVRAVLTGCTPDPGVAVGRRLAVVDSESGDTSVHPHETRFVEVAYEDWNVSRDRLEWYLAFAEKSAQTKLKNGEYQLTIEISDGKRQVTIAAYIAPMEVSRRMMFSVNEPIAPLSERQAAINEKFLALAETERSFAAPPDVSKAGMNLASGAPSIPRVAPVTLQPVASAGIGRVASTATEMPAVDEHLNQLQRAIAAVLTKTTADEQAAALARMFDDSLDVALTAIQDKSNAIEAFGHQVPTRDGPVFAVAPGFRRTGTGSPVVEFMVSTGALLNIRLEGYVQVETPLEPETDDRFVFRWMIVGSPRSEEPLGSLPFVDVMNEGAQAFAGDLAAMASELCNELLAIMAEKAEDKRREATED